ncbi:hypothetical protein [Rhizobium leguminosarum]|uniref:hypothetical protein n=1 Tax=Rhizobium leguminosarum TaxID=384 RepID=UPI0012FB4BD3|nr:hypothetical protein [Rhizobium leguminosarum]MBY5368896.1 hypothetical protein [Rhizobium leguminosarum]MBY5451891.1 hypothetical protein [Rhizobium leguminosarum]
MAKSDKQNLRRLARPLPIPQQDQNKTRSFRTDSAAVPALYLDLWEGFAERGKNMQLFDDAIAVGGGEAERRRRTGQRAAPPEELAQVAGNGRLKCLERILASITRRECDCLDL